jgi:hypothetical protein
LSWPRSFSVFAALSASEATISIVHTLRVSCARIAVEHGVVGLGRRQFGHQRNDERLRNGLTAADVERPVGIGRGARTAGNELVPLHLSHHGKHAL